MNRVDLLAELGKRDQRTIVGLMSGTSLDGIDAVLCDVSGSGRETRVTARGFLTHPFPPRVRERVFETLEGSVQDVCEVDFLVGEALAAAAQAVVDAAGVPMDSVDLIASHGQTVYHVDRSQGPTPSTLQIGQASLIAERTGRIVISDFRTRDVAAGGAGAPLVAYLDHCLFARPNKTVLLQNIGGIANVTVVRERLEDVVAFDTGPGNVLIDEVCRELLGDEDAVDRGGSYSRLGEVDADMLARLMDHDYLKLPPPKTTGREVFGAELSRKLLSNYDPTRLIDLLATVVRFTAMSIVGAYRRWVLPAGPVSEVIVSGGGVHNGTLMDTLREELAKDGVRVRSFDELDVGFSADAKEAVAFCLLANETVQGRPSNVPGATGASHPVILGQIVL